MGGLTGVCGTVRVEKGDGLGTGAVGIAETSPFCSSVRDMRAMQNVKSVQRVERGSAATLRKGDVS